MGRVTLAGLAAVLFVLCAGGKHVRALGQHPANAVLTAMQSIGWDGDTLGEVTGDLGGLYA